MLLTLYRERTQVPFPLKILCLQFVGSHKCSFNSVFFRCHGSVYSGYITMYFLTLLLKYLGSFQCMAGKQFYVTTDSHVGAFP